MLEPLEAFHHRYLWIIIGILMGRANPVAAEFLLGTFLVFF